MTDFYTRLKNQLEFDANERRAVRLSGNTYKPEFLSMGPYNMLDAIVDGMKKIGIHNRSVRLSNEDFERYVIMYGIIVECLLGEIKALDDEYKKLDAFSRNQKRLIEALVQKIKP